jgi:hypothetical protein
MLARAVGEAIAMGITPLCHPSVNSLAWPHGVGHGARAEEILEEDRAERAYQRSMRELDEALSEEELSGIECSEGVAERNEGTGEPDDRRWREIPF